ncbi:hypothetical protein EIN_369700 [Entamoeba invadens IP1]|uniref:TLDc domain-containing protein n=1 Tax=Entamoeba invadens IP1 TaxID=370355 RepID=A0A0A1UBW4_ENTIV|nr:hypothetical protein EIN_369700 [Entamoeba invadens IP1]ELP92648.1 hypothetical protein EIN_369700 [Entamoeba invadens IP1]|eukprot:XP_004259419.1 hypothetical protein EIN_369700 [Entamoeba invadens IP1]
MERALEFTENAFKYFQPTLDPQMMSYLTHWSDASNFRLVYNSQGDGLQRKDIVKKMAGLQRYVIVAESTDMFFGGFYSSVFPTAPSFKADFVTRKNHFGFILNKKDMGNPLILRPKELSTRLDMSLIIPALDEYVKESIISKDFFVIMSDKRFMFLDTIEDAYTLSNNTVLFSHEGFILTVFGFEWI